MPPAQTQQIYYHSFFIPFSRSLRWVEQWKEQRKPVCGSFILFFATRLKISEKNSLGSLCCFFFVFVFFVRSTCMKIVQVQVILSLENVLFFFALLLLELHLSLRLYWYWQVKYGFADLDDVLWCFERIGLDRIWNQLSDYDNLLLTCFHYYYRERFVLNHIGQAYLKRWDGEVILTLKDLSINCPSVVCAVFKGKTRISSFCPSVHLFVCNF